MPHHLMPCGLPRNTPCKYIYVTRNIKDAAVSYFCHYFTSKRAENFDWDIFIIGLSLVNCDYFVHALTWWKHEKVLFLRRHAEISEIASSFMNWKLSEQEIESVIEKSSFSSMKSIKKQ